MKSGATLALAAFLSVLVALAISCGDGITPTPAAPSSPTRAPGPLPTPVPPAPDPTATPVPTEDRRAALEFADNHLALNTTWDDLLADFDTWRQGLTSCDVSTVQVQLSIFAADAAAISADALDLPRQGPARALADSIIQATTAEQAAMAQLRDQWAPNDPAVFLAFADSRVSGSALRKEVQDATQALKDSSSPEAKDLAQIFAIDVNGLSDKWDSFHQDYDRFRAETLTSVQVVNRLNSLVEQFGQVLSAARDLPDDAAMRPVVQLLVSTAEDEAVALRQLRDTYEEVPGSGSGDDSGELTFVARDPSLFQSFGAQIPGIASKRRFATELMNDALAQTSQTVNDAAVDFEAAHLALAESWDAFHDSFDSWRSSLGGCDRSAAAGVLGDFAVRYGGLAATVRALPAVVQLRPLSELLIEAIERGEQAMRLLRSGWVPFDDRVYSTFDRERNSANRLRRQAATDLSGLLDQLGISPGEVSQ